MSSLKVRLFMALESFLRVPPLLIVDEIFRISFGIGNNANKYYNTKSWIPQQKTTYIPDRSSGLELSEAERLSSNDNEYSNETVNNLGAATAPTPQQQQLYSKEGGVISYFPIMNELWHFFADTIYEVFNPESQPSSASSSSAPKVSSSPIVDDIGPSAATTAGYNQQNEDFYEFSTAQAAADLIKIAEILACIALFMVAIITFMLATENLIKLYSHLVSFFALYLSFIFTPFPTAFAFGTIPSLLYNILCRSIIASVYYACRSWPGSGNGFNLTGGNGTPGGTTDTDGGGTEANNNSRSIPGNVSATECLLFGMFFVTGAVKLHPALYVILMIGLHHPLLWCLPDVYAFLKASWNETKRVQNEYGLSHLIQVEGGRLRVNTVFRLFWITRAAYDAVSKCCNEPLNMMIRYVMTHGTETFTGVVGLTVTVSAICHHIGECLLYLLYNGANTEADANRFGSISTVLFFILSLQTGLTSLDPEKRLDRLAKNIVLLGTALFHALHQMISPVLTAFRAFQTLQIRAAMLSATSFVVSACLTYYLLCHSTISTWSLAVLALAIEFKIKICISLLISFVVYLSQLVQYPEVLEKFVTLCRRILPTFMMRQFDHWHDELSHEDVVFYLRSFANVGEFLTGIFLFVNAVWIFFFESASAIRAIGMSVHAYFNIWCEAQKGWRVYCQRKTASQKIMSLADATEEQLRSRQDDVCAVCYEEMESAKVTNCNHLFHAVCLRKWLYVQNTCPLCHEVLYREDALENNDAEPTPAPLVELSAAPAALQARQPELRILSENGVHFRSPLQSRSSSQNIPVRASGAQSSSSFHPSSDENDDESMIIFSSPNNNNANGCSSSRTVATTDASGFNGGTSIATPSSSRSFCGIITGENSENGNSSSETEYTVDDGSDGDDLWADELSSSDDDEGDGDRRGRSRRNGRAIGVPLLL